MRILLVEDEDRVASFITKGLGAEGHTIERAATVADGISLACAFEFDTILLDLMLPDGDGRAVLEKVREGKSDTPVIVLSALGETDDKVDLLDLGADDYLVKPFAFAELSARIRANARQGQQSSRVLKAGDLTLDTRSRIARRGDLAVDLPSREYELLEYLMRHLNQVLSRQQLLDAVWGFDFDTGSNVVDVYIGYLRRKLDYAQPKSFVETVRGAGYRVRA
jgi:two-component system OmpR family response regulator